MLAGASDTNDVLPILVPSLIALGTAVIAALLAYLYRARQWRYERRFDACSELISSIERFRQATGLRNVNAALVPNKDVVELMNDVLSAEAQVRLICTQAVYDQAQVMRAEVFSYFFDAQRSNNGPSTPSEREPSNESKRVWAPIGRFIEVARTDIGVLRSDQPLTLKGVGRRTWTRIRRQNRRR